MFMSAFLSQNIQSRKICFKLLIVAANYSAWAQNPQEKMYQAKFVEETFSEL